MLLDQGGQMARIDDVQAAALERSSAEIQTILRSSAFKQLVEKRSRFAWMLSALMLVVYLIFIFLVAFAHGLMATKIGGGPTSLGIVLGLAVIVIAFALTGIYVSRANTVFDDLTRDVMGGRQ